ALEHEVGVYSGDVAASVVGSVERSAPTPLVAGFFNGAEGDVSLRRCERDVLDVRRLSASILTTVRAALATPGTAEPLELNVAYWDVVPRQHLCPEQRPRCSLKGMDYEIAKEPVPGSALLGGGEGDRTVLYQLGWSARVKGTAENGQDLKLPGLDSSIVPELK